MSQGTFGMAGLHRFVQDAYERVTRLYISSFYHMIALSSSSLVGMTAGGPGFRHSGHKSPPSERGNAPVCARKAQLPGLRI